MLADDSREKQVAGRPEEGRGTATEKRRWGRVILCVRHAILVSRGGVLVKKFQIRVGGSQRGEGPTGGDCNRSEGERHLGAWLGRTVVAQSTHMSKVPMGREGNKKGKKYEVSTMEGSRRRARL